MVRKISSLLAPASIGAVGVILLALLLAAPALATEEGQPNICYEGGAWAGHCTTQREWDAGHCMHPANGLATSVCKEFYAEVIQEMPFADHENMPVLDGAYAPHIQNAIRAAVDDGSSVCNVSIGSQFRVSAYFALADGQLAACPIESLGQVEPYSGQCCSAAEL